MFSLGRGLLSEIEFDGVTLYLDPSFDTVFRYLELTKDDEFDQLEKIDIMFSMFVENEDAIQDVNQRIQVLEIILRDVLGFDLEKAEEQFDGEGDAAPTVRSHDFEKDAGIIYASFLYDYQMDLFKERGRLHWRQFLALFENLSEESKMSKVIGYRTMKTPSTSKGGSAEYRKFIIEMKRKYRLEERKEDPETYQKQLSGLFSSLKEKAQKARG